MTVLERVLSRTRKNGDCWEWTGYRDSSGYGRVRANGRIVFVHRLIYEMLVEPIPKGLVIDHLCRNAWCANPAHMEVVTNRENILRGVGMGARNHFKTHCKHGHEFTAANTRFALDSRGQLGRWCRACDSRRSAAYLRKQHA
jgi:hypothetical protein